MENKVVAKRDVFTQRVTSVIPLSKHCFIIRSIRFSLLYASMLQELKADDVIVSDYHWFVTVFV